LAAKRGIVGGQKLPIGFVFETILHPQQQSEP
jgi:hypothetical protein